MGSGSYPSKVRTFDPSWVANQSPLRADVSRDKETLMKLNSILAPLVHSSSTDFLVPPARPCARPGCANSFVELWEETGLLCGRCAIETDLYDRDLRWDRVHSPAEAPRKARAGPELHKA